jgi:hypothetical protein
VADDGEVLGGVIGADAGAVLVEGEVEHPAETVLDAPVAADDALEGRGVGGEAGEEWRASVEMASPIRRADWIQTTLRMWG